MLHMFYCNSLTCFIQYFIVTKQAGKSLSGDTLQRPVSKKHEETRRPTPLDCISFLLQYGFSSRIRNEIFLEKFENQGREPNYGM